MHSIPIRLQWTPTHCLMLENDTANLLAKQALIPGKTLHFFSAIKRDGIYQAGSLCLMGEGVERVEDRRLPTSDSYHTVG
jgi:hypothetical protein